MEKISTVELYQTSPQRGEIVRHALAPLLAILLILMPNAHATETFTLGNYVENWNHGGPTGDGYSAMSYPTGRTVYFSRTSQLAPANVTINWNANHGSSSTNTNSLFCTQSNQGTGNGLSIESGLISAGFYGNVEIFKTNITGLYASVTLRSFSSYNITITGDTLPLRSGIMHNYLSLKDKAQSNCKTTDFTGTPTYSTVGGLGFYVAISFYTDQTYTPSSATINLQKSGNYHVRIWNENPGAAIKGYYDNVTFDISKVTVAEPTCTTQPVASGSSVSGTTVNLGSYSPNDIINGATAVPFAIKLAGCKGLRNINVTLASTTVATDTTLLGNMLTLNHATGVGLEIRGAANNYSPQTLMIPNESTSVYNDQRNTSGDDNIYGASENGKVQTHTLNFLATLKRDSNQKIGSGNFKANGIFTIDYP